ncbi:hypothetical protein MLD38_011537 [Melastoma candidum]|uniref:Uncharacterized protein n=1 Tax=Melastoma candidum TaxID=119954 RepID=A0ACB9R3D2_9MYRT|nr:hypothetical protein MLD38_011537 [Melastoma candidum]
MPLAISFLTIYGTPHIFVNAYEDVAEGLLASVAVTTEYSHPQVEKIREYIAEPSKSAVGVAAARVAATSAPTTAAKAQEKEPETEEDSNGDMCLDLSGGKLG